MPHNLRTLEVLLDQNADDYRIATSRSYKMSERRAAWKRLSRRRCRAVILVEELGLRTQRIEPMIDQLAKFSQRVDELQTQLERMKKQRKSLAERKPLLVEYRNILRTLQETPPASAAASATSAKCTPTTRRPSGACRRATCDWWSRSPRSTATAASRSSTSFR